jgi:phytoene dehydrogenase-like protein
MYDIAHSLVDLAENLGVKFYFRSKVEKIKTSGKRITGIRVAGKGDLAFDHVVSDIDIWYLYRELLGDSVFPGKWFRHERSTSAVVFYWGMNTLSPMLDLHNILFTGNYKEEFACLFSGKTMHNDPTVYIFISSKIVKGDAPAGCENWFVMVNAPENIGQDWDGLIHETRKRIEEKIEKMTGIEVGRHRVYEQVMDPGEIERLTASYRGSLYGNSSNSMLAAFRRHPNFTGIKGLYFTGGSVHPGGGIPLCLLSAKIVAEKFPDIKT